MDRKRTLLFVVASIVGLSLLIVGCSSSQDNQTNGDSQEQASGADDSQGQASETAGGSSMLSSEQAQGSYEELGRNQTVQEGVDFIESDHDRTIEEQIEITEIPAPPFEEEQRASYYKDRLEELGLQDVQTDEEGNVYGTWEGTGDGPTLFAAAHLDTVFPEGTDVTVEEGDDGRLYAPGIGDDARGLASLLSIINAMNEAEVETQGDIIFGGTVGEEGLGDLRGVKHFFDEGPEVDGFISLDGAGASDITYEATGSHRYEIAYNGPGGHSFGDFGRPSATHAMGRAIADISDLEVTNDPKTTFNVGTVEGGTAVNAIAAEATMLIDMRSNEEEEVVNLEEKVLNTIDQAAQDENERWDSEEMAVDINQVGDRPAASQPVDAPIVQASAAAIQSISQEPELADPSSTDSNYPMSLGIPSVTLGQGGSGENSHSVNEWYDPTDAYLGTQRTYMTVLGLVGVEGGSEPVLESR